MTKVETTLKESSIKSDTFGHEHDINLVESMCESGIVDDVR